MKIGLMTTFTADEPEVSAIRIKEEAERSGHQLDYIDLAEFNAHVTETGFVVHEYKNKYDLIIARGIFTNQKPIASFLNTIRSSGIPIFDNQFIQHKYLIDKISDMFQLAHNNIVTPETIYELGFESYRTLTQEIEYPCVFKNIKKSQGDGVYKLDTKAELVDLLNKLESEGEQAKKYILQKYIDYKYDLRVLVIGEKHFVMRRIPPDGDFRANYSIGASVEPFELDLDGHELANKAMKAINITVAGVDILIDSSGKKYVLEVNHTPGFTGMEKALSENITTHYLNHAIKSAK